MRLWLLAAGLLFAGSELLPAQARGLQRPGGRAQMEQRVRERFAEVVKERLQLSDDQMRRLHQTSQQFEQPRRQLQMQEREIRVALRAELQAGEGADQQRTAQLLERLFGIQRQRLEIFAREQQALAEFLTPVQRAKFLALQDQLHRRMEELQQRRRQQARQRDVEPDPE